MLAALLANRHFGVVRKRRYVLPNGMAVTGTEAEIAELLKSFNRPEKQPTDPVKKELKALAKANVARPLDDEEEALVMILASI